MSSSRDGSPKAQTYFASPERTAPGTLQQEIEAAASSPVIAGVLSMVGGLIAVLDENRQVLAVNREVLDAAGVEDAEGVLGLRPGEVLDCVHADELPAGCGTARWCATCGAAIAITISLAEDEPIERRCTLQVLRDGEERGLDFSVRACPIRVGPWRFLLLFMQDISAKEQVAALQRAFLHDINNMLGGVIGAAELLACDLPPETSDLAENILSLSTRIHQELLIQHAIQAEDVTAYKPRRECIAVKGVMDELERLFSRHAVSRGKSLRYRPPAELFEIRVDVPLLLRVLSNMITNACEASAAGDEVRIDAAVREDAVSFSVWNALPIPPEWHSRIFQRSFSTKPGRGRGMGTYSMKVLGETCLGGQVSFRSSPEEGTVFTLELPKESVME